MESVFVALGESRDYFERLTVVPLFLSFGSARISQRPPYLPCGHLPWPARPWERSSLGRRQVSTVARESPRTPALHLTKYSDPPLSPLSILIQPQCRARSVDVDVYLKLGSAAAFLVARLPEAVEIGCVAPNGARDSYWGVAWVELGVGCESRHPFCDLGAVLFEAFVTQVAQTPPSPAFVKIYAHTRKFADRESLFAHSLSTPDLSLALLTGLHCLCMLDTGKP